LEPDLLITDRIHPGLTGEELVWRLAERQVQFPILMLSGDVTATMNPPSDLKLVCLSKPFNRDSLWRVLNELVGPCDFPAYPLEPGHQPSLRRFQKDGKPFTSRS
jgi:FixJ family two-component response regulator